MLINKQALFQVVETSELALLQQVLEGRLVLGSGLPKGTLNPMKERDIQTNNSNTCITREERPCREERVVDWGKK
jgi:hypothetical protein